MPHCVLKIGGSLLTRRGRPFQVDERGLAAVATEIPVRDANGLVVIHGLGSFGRAVLALYQGNRIPRDQGLLARRVVGLLAELHGRFVDALDVAGVPVSPLDAGTLFAVDGDTVLTVAAQTVAAHLQAGRVVVLHGGTMLDVNGDFTIVSSDRMTVEMARALAPRRVVWATDVDGVLDRERRLLTRLDRVDTDRMWRPASVLDDPSGAMHGKISEAVRLAELGTESLIVNGARAGRIRAALAGAAVTGTLISRSVGPAGDYHATPPGPPATVTARTAQ